MWWTIPCQDLIGWSPLGSERHRACSPLRPPIFSNGAPETSWPSGQRSPYEVSPSRLKYARNAGLDLMYLLGGWGDKLLQGILLKTELHPCLMMFNVIWMILTGVVWFHVEPFILKRARWLYPFHHFYPFSTFSKTRNLLTLQTWTAVDVVWALSGDSGLGLFFTAPPRAKMEYLQSFLQANGFKSISSPLSVSMGPHTDAWNTERMRPNETEWLHLNVLAGCMS